MESKVVSPLTEIDDDEYDGHSMRNIAQLEYFKKREAYKILNDQDLVNALKEFGVPEVLREVIENRLAGLVSV